MKILMLKTKLGVRAGQMHPETFEAEKEYDIDASLFEQFEHLGAAVEVAECDMEDCPDCNESSCLNKEMEQEPEKAAFESVEQKQRKARKKRGK